MRVLSLCVLCAVLCQMCFAKPTEVLQNPQLLDPVQHEQVKSVVADVKREHRSPQFGLGGGFSESDSVYEDKERIKVHNKNERLGGCIGLSCGGYPGYLGAGGYPVPGVIPEPAIYPGGGVLPGAGVLPEVGVLPGAGVVPGIGGYPGALSPLGEASVSSASASSGTLGGPLGGESFANAESENLNVGLGL